MPSTENYQTPAQILSFLTNSAVVKNLGAKLAAGREIDEAGTSGERIVGVIQNTETSTGVDVSVVTGPCFKLVTSAAAFSDLDQLSVSAAGKFQTATAGHIVVAYAMEAASAADEDVLAFILPMSQYRIASASVVDLTDSTGLSGTHDDTLAATTVPSDLTGGESPTEGEHNTLLAVIRIMAQNASDTAQKVKEIVAVLDAQGITL